VHTLACGTMTAERDCTPLQCRCAGRGTWFMASYFHILRRTCHSSTSFPSVVPIGEIHHEFEIPMQTHMYTSIQLGYHTARNIGRLIIILVGFHLVGFFTSLCSTHLMHANLEPRHGCEHLNTVVIDICVTVGRI